MKQHLSIDFQGHGFFVNELDTDMVGTTSLTLVVLLDIQETRAYLCAPRHPEVIATTKADWEKRLEQAESVIAEYKPHANCDFAVSFTPTALTEMRRLVMAEVGASPQVEKQFSPEAAPETDAGAEKNNRLTAMQVPVEIQEDGSMIHDDDASKERSKAAKRATRTTRKKPLPKIDDEPTGDSEEDTVAPETTQKATPQDLELSEPPVKQERLVLPEAPAAPVRPTEIPRPDTYRPPSGPAAPKMSPEEAAFVSRLKQLTGQELINYAKQAGLTDGMIEKAQPENKLRGVLLYRYKNSK